MKIGKQCVAFCLYSIHDAHQFDIKIDIGKFGKSSLFVYIVLSILTNCIVRIAGN